MLTLEESLEGRSASPLLLVTYGVGGWVQLWLGLLVGLAIVRHRALRSRKEYSYLAALTFLYAYWGAGFVSAAIYRFYHRLKGDALTCSIVVLVEYCSSNLACFLNFHNF